MHVIIQALKQEQNVDVFDTTPPIPVCDEFTIVTLSNNGWAHVYAETFDDGSHDNCSAVTFSVRRLTAGCNSNGSTDEATNPFGPFVQFCCTDVGKEVMVELRVTDAFGNKNSSMKDSRKAQAHVAKAMAQSLPYFMDDCAREDLRRLEAQLAGETEKRKE